MKAIKQCNNGHFYREDLEKCPLCSDKDLQDSSKGKEELNHNCEKGPLQTQRNITDKIKLYLKSFKILLTRKFTKVRLVLDKLRSWLKINSRIINPILLVLFILYSISLFLYFYIDYHSISSFVLYFSFSFFFLLILYALLWIVTSSFSFLSNKFFYLHFFSASIVALLLFWLSLKPFLHSYISHGEEFELKDFEGYTIKDAAKELEQLGLKYHIADYIFTNEVEKGSIFAQSPISETFVKEGRTIYFTVNHSYIQKIEIPKGVFYVSAEQAKNKLDPFFKLKFIPEDYSDKNLFVTQLTLEDGTILRPKSPVGKKIEKGSTIIVKLESTKYD